MNTDGRREVLGLATGPSEAETFLDRVPARSRGPRPEGVKLVITDAHDGIKAAIARVFDATWQRCGCIGCATPSRMPPRAAAVVAAAFIATAFAQPDHAAASTPWRHVADQVRGKWPRLASLMDGAEEDVLAYMSFPPQHRAKLHSTDMIDKNFSPPFLLFFCCAVDLVAKRGASAGSVAGQPVQSLPI